MKYLIILNNNNPDTWLFYRNRKTTLKTIISCNGEKYIMNKLIKIFRDHISHDFGRYLEDKYNTDWVIQRDMILDELEYNPYINYGFGNELERKYGLKYSGSIKEPETECSELLLNFESYLYEKMDKIEELEEYKNDIKDFNEFDEVVRELLDDYQEVNYKKLIKYANDFEKN